MLNVLAYNSAAEMEASYRTIRENLFKKREPVKPPPAPPVVVVVVVAEPAPPSPPPIPGFLRYIIWCVCEEYGITKEELFIRCRKPKFVHRREVAIAMLRHLSRRSLKQIGSVMGQDHTTVLASLRRTNRFVDEVKAGAPPEVTYPQWARILRGYLEGELPHP